MTKKLLWIAAFGLILFASISARLWTLELRSVHADEAEQAATFMKLYEGGEYSYNPQGPHGPALYYWSLLSEKLLRAAGLNPNCDETLNGDAKPDIHSLRTGLALVFVLICAALASFYRLYGAGTTLGAAFCFGASSLSIIYSGYYVHEIIFALWVFLLLNAVWLFINAPSARRALFAGVCAGMCQITKETSVLAFAALFLAAAPFAGFTSKNAAERFKELCGKRGNYLLAGAAAFALIFIIFYSSAGTHFKGVTDAFASYGHFFEKSAEAAHAKEFSYYFKLLFFEKSGGVIFGEGLITILAAIGLIFAFRSADERARYFKFAALFAAANLLILSIIPYKMPWLLLSPMLVICVLAGGGAAALLSVKKFWLRGIFAAALAGAALAQISLARKSAQVYHSDPRNPFISVHTVPDFKNLIERIQKCAQVSEYKKDIPVCFYGGHSPWPLPWFLRDYPNAGFWTPQNPPQSLDVFEIIICDPASAPALENILGAKRTAWHISTYGLRPNLILTVYIKKELFEKSIEQ